MIADMLRCDIDALVVAPCDSWDCGWFRTAVEEKGILVFTTDTAALDCAIPYIGSDHQKIDRADPELFFFPLQQEVSTGFSAYLTDCRLQYVCRRLTTSTDMIKAIAADAGFLDYQHFCRTFKKRMGVSPAEYRRSKNPTNLTRK